MQPHLYLEVMSCSFSVRCDDVVSRSVIEKCYSSFLRTESRRAIRKHAYVITESISGWQLRSGDDVIHCSTLADLIYDFEKDMTIRVQLQRPELLFIHGAAIACEDRCVMIAGESGAGKSTLCWTACNEGFEYMSDELAPVNVSAGLVEPYPHAICLKERPDYTYPLPAEVVDASRTIHVNADDIPGDIAGQLRPLAAIVFIDQGRYGNTAPVLISAAEAAMRLYANSLNQLAHENDGLAAVRRIAKRVPSYMLRRAAPTSMVDSVRQVLESCRLAA